MSRDADSITISPRRKAASKRKRILLTVAALLLALLAIGAVRIAPFLWDSDEYASVASIEGGADYRNRALMAAAWRLPVAATYAAKPFEYQKNPSFCGPASIANLLRSAGIDMSQVKVIDGTGYDPWFDILIGGLTLDELAVLLRLRSGQPVARFRDMTLAQFRAHLARANDPAMRYIVNFHRGPLFGRGHGHFSPILGYLAARDLVLVGDVNRDYRPFLVSGERLWRGQDTIDSATGKKRGLLAVRLPSA